MSVYLHCKDDRFVATYITSNGQRSSAEFGYLISKVLSRPNLHVVTGAQVTKLLVTRGDNGAKRAVGVEFIASKNELKFRVHARKEVVLW